MIKVIGLMFIGVVVSLIGIAIVWIVMADLRRRAEKRQRILDLSFQEIDHPDQSLIKRIIELHQKREKQLLEVPNLLVRQGPDYQLYLFDLRDNTGECSSLVKNGLALLSADLHLPRFSLYPKIMEEGKLALLANLALNKLASRKGLKVTFASCPEFEERYMLVGENEDEVRGFFTEERLRSLSETKYWMIEAGENMFTFDRFEVGEGGERIRIDAILDEGRIDDALNALKIFTAPVCQPVQKELASSGREK